MPVILTTAAEVDLWLWGETADTLALQRPLSDSAARIVAKGEKEDGAPAGSERSRRQRRRTLVAAFQTVLCKAASTEGDAMSERRELYRSPNGDSWFLGREPESGYAFIIHQPNAPSGGRKSHTELGEFLRQGTRPEHQALLRLIGTLVDVPPFSDRT
jgi:hypothetical protein